MQTWQTVKENLHKTDVHVHVSWTSKLTEVSKSSRTCKNMKMYSLVL